MGSTQVTLVRDAKRTMRKEAQRRRRSLPPDLRTLYSALATDRLTRLASYRRSGVVMAFASFGDEIDTGPLLRQVIADGKLLVLPAVVPGQHDLELRLVPDLTLLRSGKWGIPEPAPGSATVGPGDLELIVVPGLAFDELGFRVGYGGGYYDRLLRRARRRAKANALACGLGYECQVWQAVPVGPRDQTLDCLATDAGVRWFGQGRDLRE